MACGLGAVALMFVFIKESTFTPLGNDFTNEVSATNRSINELNIKIEKNSAELSKIIVEKINRVKELEQIDSKTNIVNSTIKELSNSNAELLSTLQAIEVTTNTKYTPIKKEYISGCNVSGRKIIFLLDTSKSMLAKEVINILELSLRQDEIKNKSNKWIQAKNTMRWLIDNTPETSEILVAGFNMNLSVAVKQGEWTKITQQSSIERQLVNLFSNTPDNGTNLQQAIYELEPWKDADSIYLITDGLPTQAIANKRSIKITDCLEDDYVSGSCRLTFFNEFIKELSSLSSKIKLNTILLPMKGDPDAPYHFSLASTLSRGCFMTPSKEWP